MSRTVEEVQSLLGMLDLVDTRDRGSYVHRLPLSAIVPSAYGVSLDTWRVVRCSQLKDIELAT